MKDETAMRLQAWVDGDASAPPPAEVAALLERDPEARALAAELRMTRDALREGEPVQTVPETREFYWSKIERAIAREQDRAVEAPAIRPSGWLLRWLAPAGILAMLALLVASPVLRGRPGLGGRPMAEIDSPLDDLSSFSFRSESEGMTVVWVNTK